MSTWYYMKDGTQVGPIGVDELKSLLASGAVKLDVMVWREGMPAWATANSQPELAVAAPATPPPPPPAQAVAGEKPSEFVPDPADVDQNKAMAVLSYIIFFIPLLAARQSKYAMFHCNQGFILFLTWLVIWVSFCIVSFVLAFIPIVGWILDILLWMGLGIGCLAMVVIGIINAANGKCKPLPLIGRLFTLVK